ncbi:MAG TPA: O-antigen ligase family protein [Syntrophorhabdaceae bacterium]|nr:O-antigen ligase family protein [Syntrophorhabdaceae bacterium]
MTIMRFARFSGFLVFCFVPFLGGNHLPLFYFTIDKFWLESIFIILLIFSLLLFYLAGTRGITHEWGRFSLLLAPLFVMNAASLLYTWNILDSLEEINVLVWVFAVACVLFSLRDRSIVLQALVIGSCFSAFCSILQFTVLYPKLTETLRFTRYAALVGSQPIPFASFLYHNILGGYLAAILPISFYFAASDKKILYSCTTTIILAGLILTTTRIGIGLALLSIVVLLAISVKDRNPKSVFHLVGLTCAGFLLAYALMNIHVPDAPKGVQREITQKIASIPQQVKTLNTRTEIWKGGLKAFVNKPIIGYGAGTFEHAYKKFYDGSFASRYAHSGIIKTGVELGAAGLACWFFYIIALVYRIRSTLWNKEDIHILLACCSILIFGMLDFSFDTAAHVLTFYMFSGLLIIAPNDKSLTAKEQSSVGRNVSIFLLISLVTVSLYFTTKTNAATKAIEIGDTMRENGFALENVFDIYRNAVQEMPFINAGHIKSVETLITMSVNSKSVAEKSAIDNNLRRHLRKLESMRDIDSEVFFITGMGNWILGDVRRAEHNLAKALKYLPSSSFYALRLAEFYMSRGDRSKAVKVVDSFKQFLHNYEKSKNPNGAFVYRLRDIRVDAMLKEKDRRGALKLAVENLEDAQRERFVITSVRARAMVEKESIIGYLQQRVNGLTPLKAAD